MEDCFEPYETSLEETRSVHEMTFKVIALSMRSGRRVYLRRAQEERAQIFSLRSANGTCALSQRGFLAISFIEVRVLLQSR